MRPVLSRLHSALADFVLAQQLKLRSHEGMQVKVTIFLRGRAVPLEDVKDPRISAPFRAMAVQVQSTLDAIRCPDHGKTATDVRIIVDAKGSAALKYESCCPTLGALISKALG
jgi:hypothetical protein